MVFELSSWYRVVFIPLFMYCNAAPTQRHLPIVFHSDADFIMFMIFFSVSNGYLGNLCMIHGPKTATSSELQETTAMVLVACLVLGTGSGSFLSYPLTTALWIISRFFYYQNYCKIREDFTCPSSSIIFFLRFKIGIFLLGEKTSRNRNWIRF